MQKQVQNVKIHSVEKGTVKRVSYKVIPYEEIASELRQGREVLVEGISRQLARYAAGKLSKMLGKKVVYFRGIIEDKKTGEPIVSGYSFAVEEQLE